jgi:cellular nucleic acid-binding protein
LNNQSTKDISTVCFRCGQVGHMESNCPNPAKPKPCCLCGMTDHDFRQCPNKQVCFNCGQPGHVSRECKMRRGLPRRMVCGNCFQSGHHRLQCQRRGPHPVDVSQAICMDTGQRGRFMSKELKWFYGLRGMSCFNCGSQGHSGYDCDRPTLYQCINNPDEVLREIERAEANSM